MPLRRLIRWFSGRKNIPGQPADPAHARPFTVVISSPRHFPQEQKIVCRLLDTGLSRFHLRKPDWSADKIRAWLKKIPAAYHSRIVVHAQPEIVQSLRLGGLHLRAAQQRPRDWTEGTPVSQSCHSFHELDNYAQHCAYATLGPVFPSVSKKGYLPQRTPEEYAVILECWAEEKGCPVLALGGITPQNIPRVRQLGFAGFAVVGAVWEAPDPVKGFQALLKAWR